MEALEAAGFVPLPVFSAFIAHNGPFWFRLTPEDRFEVAMRVEPRHANPMGQCHGGMLMTLADAAMSGVVAYEAAPQKMSPSVSVTSHFIRPALQGDDVIARVAVERSTQALAFARCELVAANAPTQPLLTAHGIYALPARTTTGFDLRAVLRGAFRPAAPTPFSISSRNDE